MHRLIAIILLAVPFAMGIAEVHFVSPAQSIQDTVNCAAELDTIVIGDGSYHETVVTYGKSLVIGSHFLLDADINHIANTIIRPGTAHPDTASCFVYAYGERPGNRLVGLTLRDGTGTWQRPTSSYDGGGVYACSSSVSIEWCRITNCAASRYGGGIMATDWSSPLQMRFELHVTDCRIDSCTSAVWGGGMSASACSLSLRRSRFEYDSAGYAGGGGSLTAYAGDIDSCVFSKSLAWEEGGLFMGWGYGNLSNCAFDSNTASAYLLNGHLCSGYMEGSVTGCTFKNSLSRGCSVELWAQAGQMIRFVHNVVEENLGQDGGPTIRVWYPHGGEIGYNVVRNNVNHSLPVIQLAGSGTTIRIHHNVLQQNVCENTSNASVAETQVEPCMSLDSNWIAGNSNQTVALYEQMTPCIVDARNNWWGDPSGPYHPTLNPTGRGDTLLSDSVLFIPWLTSPPDTSFPPGYLAVRERPAVPRNPQLLECYPNPFNSSIRIRLSGFTGKECEVTLHNVLGQQVDVIHRGRVTGGEIAYKAPPSLASGVYFVRVTNRSSVLSKKVILMK